MPLPSHLEPGQTVPAYLVMMEILAQRKIYVIKGNVLVRHTAVNHHIQAQAALKPQCAWEMGDAKTSCGLVGPYVVRQRMLAINLRSKFKKLDL